jgi:hypothetical protein
MEDLEERDRHIELTVKDMALLNPNTKTCPIFRSRRDAELTREVYRNVPVLVDENRRAGGNPWGVKFLRMFDQTNDAESFKTGKELKEDGFKLDGNRWTKRKQVYLPLYEAKMIQAFDHRAAGVVVQAGNWMRQGQTDDTSLVQHQNPEFVVLPRFWVADEDVRAKFGNGKDEQPAFLGIKDITSPTNQRTMIAAAIPWSAVTNHFPLILSAISWRRRMCLLANLNALSFDYVTRQKIGGVTLNFFIVEQLPTFPPDRYGDKCPWDRSTTLEKWISERALKLTCTSNDMAGLAEAAGFKPRVYPWKNDERDQLRAELDAAYFILYGIERADMEYILGTFQGVADEDEAHNGIGVTRGLILEAFDRLTK